MAQVADLRQMRANYEDSEGCLLPVGIGYKKVESDFYINYNRQLESYIKII